MLFYSYMGAVDFNIITQQEWAKTKISRRRKVSSKDFCVALTLGKFMKQSEVEHLFDAHYRASRPRRRIIRVYGGVRGAGAVGDLARGLYSPLRRPATSTSLYSVLPTWRSPPFSLVPPPYSTISFPLGIHVLSSRRFRLPTTCEGDGAAVQLYELRSRRYFAFGVHSAIILIALSSVVPLRN